MDLSRSPDESRRWRGVELPAARHLLISEVFGPTLQGEGPSTGRSAMFVRLGMCNLRCQWCDTPYSWDDQRFDLRSELGPRSVESIVDEVGAARAGLVVITGGEPTIQATYTAWLADSLRSRGKTVELETNGTLPLGPLDSACDLVVVSPKLANSGVPEHARLRYEVLMPLAQRPRTAFKFVVAGPADLDEIDVIAKRAQVPDSSIWVMPEARTTDQLTERMRDLAQAVAQRGWSLSGRLQVLLWSGIRGH
jgi:7-carboxy-7-deazaguanine synthase